MEKKEEYEVFILFILSNPCIYIVYLRNILNKWFLIVSDILIQNEQYEDCFRSIKIVI